jgi:hypothetical protein
VNTIDTVSPYRLRGLLQQTDEGLLWTPPSVRVNQAGGDPPASITRQLLEGFSIAWAGLQNRSGSTVVVGVGGRLPNRYWRAGQWVNAAGTPFTDDTVDAQSAAATDFPLETLTVNDGFVVASPYPFNAISIRCATASTGVGVRAVSYSNFAGSGWTTLTNLFVQDVLLAGTQYVTATENLFVFGAPADWGQTQVGGLSGIPGGLYAIRVQATTVPTLAGVASSMAVCQLYLGTEGLIDNNVWSYEPTKPLLRFPQCDGLVALFSTADPGNRVTAHVVTGG